MRRSEREQKRRVVGRQQQRQLLGRGEQNVRRIARAGAAAATAGVSPVRVSTLTGSFISAIGVSRLRAMSTASAFSGEM